MICMKKIILASQSPRRKELVEKGNIPFTQDPANIDETIDSTLPLTQTIQQLSKRKALAVLQRHKDAIVIGSDTIVVLHNEVLGKPHTKQEAYQMLNKLQGNTHEVITGIAFVSNQRTYTNVSVSKVTFSKMSDDEIEKYILTGEYKDKAGAYGIQGYGGRYISHIDGDYYAIMGLPLNLVYEELKNIGLY